MRKRHEVKSTGFLCLNCKKFVKYKALGTRHRNHCPFCLFSKHLDFRPGDRSSVCAGAMEPICLTFKAEGEGRTGEIMVVHSCKKCGTVGKNRIAGDDDPEIILGAFRQSLKTPVEPDLASRLAQAGIALAGKREAEEVVTQLFGKPNLEAKLAELR